MNPALKAIYTPKGAAREYAALALNNYTGCDHGCLYCYGPATTKTTRDKFSSVSLRAGDLLAKVRSDAKTLAEGGCKEYINLCFTCDPYSHFDEEHRITREILTILLDAGLNIQILTKGGERGERDFDILEKYKDQVRYGVTLTFSEEGDREKWEPHAAPTHERIEALKKAYGMGIDTWVSIEPVIDPIQSLELIRVSAPFTHEFKIGKLNHNKTHEAGINWLQFGNCAIELCEYLKVRYTLKEDLVSAMQRGEGTTPAPEDSRIAIPEALRPCRFILVSPRDKRAIEPGWQKARNYAADDPKLIAHITAGGNYGVIPTAGICVMDADDPARLDSLGILDRFNGKTYTVMTGRDNAGLHIYFRCPDIPATKIHLKDPETGDDLGDIRGSHHPSYTVGPGSIHPSGRRYEPIDPDAGLMDITWEDLQAAIAPAVREEPPTISRRERAKADPKSRSIVDKYGLTPQMFLMPENARQQGQETIGGHPVHGSTTGTNLTISPDGLWYCRRCGSGGDALIALAVAEGIIECSEARSGCLDNHWSEVMEALQRRGYADEKPKRRQEKKPTPTLTEEEKEAIRLAGDRGIVRIASEGEILAGITKDHLIQYGILGRDEEIIEEKKGEIQEKLKEKFFSIAVSAKYGNRKYAVGEKLSGINQKITPALALTIEEIDRVIRLADVLVERVRRTERENTEKQEKMREEAEEQEKKGKYSEDARKEAARIMEKEDPVKFLLETFHSEHVSDATIAKCCYVSAASRYISNSPGLHVLTIGPSGKGKSSSYGTILKQMPNYQQLDGAFTDKALFYHEVPERCIFVLDDKSMSEPIQEIFRSSTSDIRKPITLRTVDTQRKPIEVSIPAGCVWWMASAEDMGDDQFHNRTLQPYCDASEKADQDFFERMLKRAAEGDPCDEDPRFEVSRYIWEMIHEAGSIPVWVWYAEAIEYYDQANRRNGIIFLDLIRAFARIRYLQRGREKGMIVALREDFDDALKLYRELTTEGQGGGQVHQMTPEEKKILEVMAALNLGSTDDSGIGVKDIVETSGITEQKVRRALQGRPDRNTGHLLSKCPALTRQEVTETTLEGDGKRKGHRETRYFLNQTIYNQWILGGQILINEERYKKVFSHFSQSFPGLFPVFSHDQKDPNNEGGGSISHSIRYNTRERKREREGTSQSTEAHTDHHIQTSPHDHTHDPDHDHVEECVGACEITKWEKTDLEKARMSENMTRNKKQSSNNAHTRWENTGKRLGKVGKRLGKDTPLPGVIDMEDLQPTKNKGRCHICDQDAASFQTQDGQLLLCRSCYNRVLQEVHRS